MSGVERSSDDLIVEQRSMRGRSTGRAMNAGAGPQGKVSEDRQQAYVHFLESLERVDDVIRATTDVEEMLRRAMDVVQAIFDTDRAWLFHPCDPEATSFRVPVEATRPEYPGALALGRDVAMAASTAEDCRMALAAGGPVMCTNGTDQPVSAATSELFSVQAQMFTALRPKVGKPWLFGLHQCAYARVWTADEQRLFTEIGRRIADGLSTLLILRDLRESEERFRQLVENIRQVFWMENADGSEVLYVSPAVEQIWGRSCAEMSGPASRWLDTIHPADRGRAAAANLRTRETGSYSEEFRIIRPDGSVRWIWDRGVPIRDAAGHITRMVGIAEDITERKQAEEERQALEAQLRQSQKMEAIGQLAGGIAHDFNNILTAILGNVELLQHGLADRLAPDDLLMEGLAHIERAGRRAADLTRQLLAFSRKQLIKPRVLDLHQLLGGMQKMLRRLIREDIELEIDCAPDVWRIRADPSQVEQVIMNLVVNARDAMPDGGRVSIRVANVRPDTRHGVWPAEEAREGHVLIAVSDTGTGIAEEIRQHIFEPFFTTKQPGEGTGLGLATVHGIVRQADGHVTVESVVGRGTTFNVYLPGIQSEVDDEPAREGTDDELCGSETVLICEDDEAVRELAAQALGRRGYRVLAAQNADRALELARAHTGPIDILVTDVIMPGMNGRELAGRLVMEHADLRVLFVSGYTADVIGRQGALEEGLNFLEKPYKLKTLLARVRELLDA